MNRIAILTNIIPTYREDFYDRIFSQKESHIHVFCQANLPGNNIKSIHRKYNNKITLIPYFAPFKNEKLILQWYPWFHIFRNYDIIVVDGNLRHLFLAIFSTICKFFGKKVIIWSNVYSAGGNSFLQRMRIFWWKYFTYFLMYTEKDKEILLQKHFKNKIIVSINNGLNQNLIEEAKMKWNNKELEKFKKENNIFSNNIIISSGRVNAVHQHIVALKALELVKSEISDVLWVVIGSGNELQNLKDKSKELNLEDNIVFLGEVYDETIKAPWFLISKILIHPGYIGLSIFNSFGYGLPVITHNNINNHSPEFYLFQENKTGYLFLEGNHYDLSEKIKFALKSNNSDEMKRYVLNIVKSKHNTEKMAVNFFTLIKNILK